MKKHIEDVYLSNTTTSFNVFVGGNLDMNNNFCYSYRKGVRSRKKIIFQPASSLKIINKGDKIEVLDD